MPTAIDASRTIAEIVLQHEETRSVFVRHGLTLDRVGTKTLAEVCAEFGLEPPAMERELLHAIDESAPFAHGGFEWDAKANIVRVSLTLADMLELEPRDFLGPPTEVLVHVHPGDRDRVRALFRRARGQPRPFAFEYRVVHADGATRIYASQVVPIDDTPRFIGMSWDITEQRPEAEPGPLLRNTLEATADGILVIDRAGHITSYNQRFLALWNIPHELAERGSDLAMQRYVLDQLEDPKAFLDGVDTLYANPEREGFDVLRFKDGRAFERYSRPQRVAFAIVGRVWSFRDVTERERLLAAKSVLADSSRLLLALDLRNALDGVVNIAVPCLGEACAIEVFGEPQILATYSRDPEHPFAPAWPAEVRAGKSLMFDRDGASELAVPITIKDQVAGAVGARVRNRRHTRADLDLAERITLGISLVIENARLYERAELALRAREQFLSIAAHELRGPLSALNLAVQTLRRRDVPEPTRDRMLLLIERESRRLTRFADDITDITRVRAGDLPFADARVDLVEVVRDAVKRMRADIERSGSVVSIDAPHPVFGRWDRVRLEQLVTSLVVNALKFGLGRPVEVAVSAADGVAMLTVSDHGLGVPASQRETIFRPFERAVSARHYGGLGLGLFIVRTIVTRYGGSVFVEPRDHGGSRFVVRLPQEKHP